MSITVIIPTYHPGNYLYECLDSLHAQTLPTTQWEMIIVLNGCDEPWHTQIQAYLSENKIDNARLIQTNSPGVSNARNIGIEAARGEYIAFIDDDDYISETYLDSLLQITSKDTIAASNTKAFSDEQAYLPYYIEKEYIRHAKESKQAFYKAKKYFGGPCMKLIHREMIGNTRFDTRFSNGEDSLFMFAISNQIKYIRFTGQNAIYFRRLRVGSATQEEKGWKVIKNRLKLIHAFHVVYWKHPFQYSFYFYFTRILGAIHSILIKL